MLAFTDAFACSAGADASAVLLVELSLAATVFSLVASLEFSTLALAFLALSVAVVLSSAF